MRDGNPYRCSVSGCDEGPWENGLCYWHQPNPENAIPVHTVRGKDHFVFEGNGLTAEILKFRDGKRRDQFTCWYVKITDADGKFSDSEGMPLERAVRQAKARTEA